jgi:hypothetical protein
MGYMKFINHFAKHHQKYFDVGHGIAGLIGMSDSSFNSSPIKRFHKEQPKGFHAAYDHHNKKQKIHHHKDSVEGKLKAIGDPEDNRNIAIHGKFKNGPSNSEFTSSTYSYPPGKVSKNRGSRYDRTNCQHGTLTNGYGFTDSWTPGTQLFKTYGRYSDEYSPYTGDNFTSLNQITNIFGHNNTLGTSPVAAYPIQLVEIVWQKVEYEFVNNALHPITLVLWDMQATMDQQDGTWNVNGGATLYWDGIVQARDRLLGLKPNIAGVLLNAQMNVNSPDFVPYCTGTREAWKFWRAANATQVTLKPGMRHTHTTFHKKNWVYDSRKYGDITVEDSTYYTIHKFQTTALLVQGRGHVVRIKNNATANAGNVTFDGGEYSMYQKVTTFMRQHVPFQDYFSLDLTAAHTGAANTQGQSGVPGYVYVNAITDTQDVELDGPVILPNAVV